MTGTEETLLQALKKWWGYDSFRPLQQPAMEAVMRHQDSVVVLPTGGGKSLCFQAPAVCMDGLGLVVSPLISLMKDQVDALRSCGIAAAYVNSTLSAEERRSVADEIKAGTLKLLYVAPERLVDTKTIDFLKAANLSMVAIDEAHCISAWGHDFRPEYRQLRLLKEHFPNIGVHAYTATASERVRRDIADQLQLQRPDMLVGNFDRPNLIYHVLPINNRYGQVAQIVQKHPGDAGIIYCISRKEVDKMAAMLEGLGCKAAPYHAGLEAVDRKRNQEAFITEQVDVIVATVAFGMGIDKSNVRYVVHAGMPKSLEHYQQESGRAGRDGLEADCTLLFSGGDVMTWKRIIEGGDAQQPGAIESLNAMYNFCTSAMCRHQSIVRYFGQELTSDNCGACDVCLGEVDLVDDPITLGQKILSNVLRVNERFGADYNAKVLTGSREQRILDQGHDSLSTHGLLGEDSVATVRAWIEQLVEQGYLAKEGEYNTLSVTDAGRQLLKREAEPQLIRPADKKSATRSVFDDSWEGVDRELFARLRTLRSEQAVVAGVPAYVIFSDVALRDMARRRPSSDAGLLQVKGVGEKKLADYGESFLALIAEHCDEHELEMDVTPPPAKPSTRSQPAKVNHSSVAAFELFRAGASIEDVAEKMSRARSTVFGYLNDYLKHEQITDPSAWVEAALVTKIEASITKVGCERLRPIYDELNEEVPYDDIRVVTTCWNNRQPTEQDTLDE